MQLHQKLLALSLVTSVLLPLILLPVPTLAEIQPATPWVPARQTESQICSLCGVVTLVNLIEPKDEDNHPGAGMVGALLVSQVSNGRALEATSRIVKQYEVVLRMLGGTAQTVTYATEPGFKVGDKVQIISGVLTHRP